MTSIIRKTIELKPEVKQSVLSVQRQINNAVVPYVMNPDEPDWRDLSFLLNANTAELTQSLSISSEITDEQVKRIAEFVIRRGKRPFVELKMDLEDFIRIEETLEELESDVGLGAYEYEMNSYENDNEVEIAYPNYTRRIEMTMGRILHVPIEIKELFLSDVSFGDDVLVEIGKAKGLRKLFIDNNHFTFHGLPPLLEELLLSGLAGHIRFDPNFNYDCPHLHTLQMSSSTRFPDEFIDSIADSL
jgi:hypothetical protein